MVEVKGKKVAPKYTVGALEEYYELTGEDILFDGGAVNTPLKRKSFLLVGIKYGTPKGAIKTLEEVDEMEAGEFFKVFTACLDVFTKVFEVEDVGPSEEKETVKKN